MINCPKCNVEMNVNKHGSVETDECPTCGGIWVDKFEEKQALEMEPAVFTADDIYNFRKLYKPEGKTEEVRYFKCPKCGEMMWRKNYMSHSGIIVDSCNEHGTFFDKGELEKAMEFVKKGGVEFEKYMKHHRAIRDSHAKLTRKIDHVETTMWRLHWIARFMCLMRF
jgi:Zn-finger nucleic acid-binding protein